MKLLFVDTSALVAVTFAEAGVERVRDLIRHAEELFAAPLLEAEFRAALSREGVAADTSNLHGLRWVLPDRALSRELERVFHAGHLRGADAWHVANALFLLPALPELQFLTLDERQRDVAAAVGLTTI